MCFSFPLQISWMAIVQSCQTNSKSDHMRTQPSMSELFRLEKTLQIILPNQSTIVAWINASGTRFKRDKGEVETDRSE